MILINIMLVMAAFLMIFHAIETYGAIAERLVNVCNKESYSPRVKISLLNVGILLEYMDVISIVALTAYTIVIGQYIATVILVITYMVARIAGRSNYKVRPSIYKSIACLRVIGALWAFMTISKIAL